MFNGTQKHFLTSFCPSFPHVHGLYMLVILFTEVITTQQNLLVLFISSFSQ